MAVVVVEVVEEEEEEILREIVDTSSGVSSFKKAGLGGTAGAERLEGREERS